MREPNIKSWVLTTIIPVNILQENRDNLLGDEVGYRLKGRCVEIKPYPTLPASPTFMNLGPRTSSRKVCVSFWDRQFIWTLSEVLSETIDDGNTYKFFLSVHRFQELTGEVFDGVPSPICKM